MVNKNYARGFWAEDKCVKQLREAGGWAERNYASKGTLDVVSVDKEGLTHLIQVKRSRRNIVSIEAINHQFATDLEYMRLIPDLKAGMVELWVWFDRHGKAGEQGYRKAGWRKFRVLDKGLIEMEV